jgi:hypothetical protein
MIDDATAREELRGLGIPNPSPDLVKNWVRSKMAEQELVKAKPAPTPAPVFPAPSLELAVERPAQVQPPRQKPPRGFSKSKLEPTLREQGTLQRQKGPRKPGRPRIIAGWFPEVAQSIAAGMSLKEALKKHGITLDQRQIRAVYRNEEFKKLRREYLGARPDVRQPAFTAAVCDSAGLND